MAENNSPGYIEAVASSKRKSKEDLRIDQLIPSEILQDSGESGIKLLLEKYYEFMNIDEFIYNENETHTDLILDNKATFRIRDESNDNNQFYTDETGGSSTLTITSFDEFLPRAASFDGTSTSVVDTTENTILLTGDQQAGMPIGSIVRYNATSGQPVGNLEHHKTYYIAYSFAGRIKLSETLNGNILNISAVAGGGNHSFSGISKTINVGISANNIAISNGNELPGSLKKSESDIGKTLTVNGLGAFNGLSANITTPITNWVGPGPSYILNSIEDAMDIDKNSDSEIDTTNQYLEMMQKEIAAAIPRSVSTVNLNKNTLYKRIVDFYKIRGSSDSIETFFRLLFNDSVEVSKPYDNTLVPSTSDWSNDTEQFISTKGFLSEKKIRIHDSYRYQKYSYLIKTGKNLEDWENVFNRLVHPAGFIFFGEILILLENIRANELSFGDNTKTVTRQTKDPQTGLPVIQNIPAYGNDEDEKRFTLSSMPGIQPGVIGIEDIPLLVKAIARLYGPKPEAFNFAGASVSPILDSNGTITSFDIIQSGSGYTAAPSTSAGTITITGTNTAPANVTAAIDSNGKIESITINNGGAGYTNAIGISIANPTDSDGNTLTQLSHINMNRLYGKKFRQKPTIYIDAPQAKDADDLPLATNVQASAEFKLQPTGVEHIKVTDKGSGYTSSPDITFTDPHAYYTAPPLFSENFTSASVSTSNYDSWRNVTPGHGESATHTISIEDDPDDNTNKVLKVQTDNGQDTNASGNIGGAVALLSLWAPDNMHVIQGNGIKVKFRAKVPSSNGATQLKAAYSTNQHGNSNWKAFTPTAEWQDFEFEYNVSTDDMTNEDYIAFQGDGNNGIVYIDDVQVIIKKDYPLAVAIINNLGQVDGIKMAYPGSGYRFKPIVTIAGAAQGEAYMQPSEIESVHIINHGHGYVLNPDVRIASDMQAEERVVDETIKLILSLNHTDDASSIIYDNSYYGLKGDAYYTTSKKFDLNQTIEQFGSQTIESNNINNINKYNINSFFKK